MDFSADINPDSIMDTAEAYILKIWDQFIAYVQMAAQTVGKSAAQGVGLKIPGLRAEQIGMLVAGGLVLLLLLIVLTFVLFFRYKRRSKDSATSEDVASEGADAKATEEPPAKRSRSSNVPDPEKLLLVPEKWRTPPPPLESLQLADGQFTEKIEDTHSLPDFDDTRALQTMPIPSGQVSDTDDFGKMTVTKDAVSDMPPATLPPVPDLADLEIMPDEIHAAATGDAVDLELAESDIGAVAFYPGLEAKRAGTDGTSAREDRPRIKKLRESWKRSLAGVAFLGGKTLESAPEQHASLNLNADSSNHLLQYHYYKNLWNLAYGIDSHDSVSIFRTFRAGLDGEPTRETFPFIYWRQAEKVFDFAANRRLDEIMNPLLFHFLRLKNFPESAGRTDVRCLKAMVNYCIWKGRDRDLYDIVFRYRNVAQFPIEITKIAGMLSLLGSEENIEILSPDLPMNDTEAALILLLKRAQDPSATKGPQEGPQATMMSRDLSSISSDELKIAWLQSAAAQDYDSERSIIDLLRRKSANHEDILCLYSGLLNRGFLFRANRLLLKSKSWKQSLCSLVLHNYYTNGKYFSVYNRIRKQKEGHSVEIWYYWEAALRVLFGNSEHETDEPFLFGPPQRDKKRFLSGLKALETGKFDPRTPVKTFGDIILRGLYFKNVLADLNAKTDRNGYHVELADMLGDFVEEPADLLRWENMLGELYLANIDRETSEKSYATMIKSLAGRIQSLRIYLGVRAYEAGDGARAILYFNRSPQHPLPLHLKAKIQDDAGDSSGALVSYRLLLRVAPNEAIFWYNFGILNRRSGRTKEAIDALKKALELNPDLEEARRNLVLLQSARKLSASRGTA